MPTWRTNACVACDAGESRVLLFGVKVEEEEEEGKEKEDEEEDSSTITCCVPIATATSTLANTTGQELIA